MMRRCPSFYTTQEAEPQSDPAHITLVCKYHQRFFDILMLLKNSPVFLPVCCVFRSLYTAYSYYFIRTKKLRLSPRETEINKL